MSLARIPDCLSNHCHYLSLCLCLQCSLQLGCPKMEDCNQYLRKQCKWFRDLTSRQYLGNYAFQPLPGRTGRWAFSPASTVLSLSVQSQGVPWHPFKNCFYFCCNPVGFANASPVGYQTQLIRGTFLRWRPSKLGCQIYVVQTLSSSGVGGSLWIVWCCAGWGLWQYCVSAFPTHCNVGIFSVAG